MTAGKVALHWATFPIYEPMESLAPILSRARRKRRPLLGVGASLGACFLLVGSVLAEASLPLPEHLFPELARYLDHSAVSAPGLIEADLSVDEARAEAAVGKAGRRPHVSGYARYVGRGEERGDLAETRWTLDPQVGFIARQPLYHWGAIEAAERIGEIRLSTARENREELAADLQDDVRRRYLDLVVRRQRLAVARQRARVAQQESAVVKLLANRGERTDEDILEADLMRREATMEAARLERDLDRARRDLGRLVGLDVAEPDGSIPSFPAGDGHPLLSSAIAGRGRAVSSAAAQVAETEEQLRLERARDRPRLNLIAGVTQDQIPVFDRSDVDRLIGFAGVELTWDIWSGNEASARREAALARRRIARERMKRLEEEAERALTDVISDRQGLIEQLRLAEEWLEHALRLRDLTEVQTRRGEVAETALERAKLVVAERELSLAIARGALLLNHMSARRVAGMEPYPR